MRRFSWQRGLTRGIGEFLTLQVPGAGEARYIPDPDGREFITARFDHRGVVWTIKVETPAERGPLGWISIIKGPATYPGGPIDMMTWNEIGTIIRVNSPAFSQVTP